jgi:hypothetical protein
LHAIAIDIARVTAIGRIAWAYVTSIAYAIQIRIGLERVIDSYAVIFNIKHPIAVRVSGACISSISRAWVTGVT